MGLLEDIKCEPNILENAIKTYETDFKDLLKECKKLLKGREIFFTGMGTSYCISLAGVYFMAENNLWASACESGELYYYKSDALPKNAAIVLISQSGESAEPKLVAKKFTGKLPLVAITNNESSTIAKKVDIVLPMLAGEESLMSTRTYINGLLCTLLISEILRHDNSNICINDDIKEIPEKMKKVINLSFNNIDKLIEALGYFNTLIVLGRGPVLSNVHDASIILKEATSISSEGIGGAYFRHGPIELTGPGCSLIIFAPTGKTTDLIIGTAYEAVKVRSKVLLFTDKKVKENDNFSVFNMPTLKEYLVPFIYIIPIQVMATKMAIMSGKVKGGEVGVLYRVGKTIDREI